MSVILVFIVVVLGLALWWLSQQRLMTKPWLETGTGAGAGGYNDTGLPTAKIALIVFLAVAGRGFLPESPRSSAWRAGGAPKPILASEAHPRALSLALDRPKTARRPQMLGTARIGRTRCSASS
jgi:hypothetical protein